MTKSNALYRKEHWFAIKLKSQMYKRLPHANELTRQSNRRRKNYYRRWYEKNRERLIKKAAIWAQQNRERKRSHQRKYKRKIKSRGYNWKPKIKRVVQEFYDYCQQRYSKSTVKQNKINIGRFLMYLERPGVRSSEYHAKFYREHKKLPHERDFSWRKNFHKIRFTTDFKRELITNYVSFVNHDEVNNGMKLNSSQKAYRLHPLRAFLLYCQRKGYIKKDLRRFVILPPREKKVLKRVMTPDEMARFLEAPGDKEIVRIRDRALLELAYSGFRANEILTLKFKHVDLHTNAVTILNTKGDKDRVVPMTAEAIYWIKRWLNRRDDYIENNKESEYIFATKNGRAINRRNFSFMIKKYAKKAKIPIDVAPHDLRRATATHLAENGAPIRLIQALLGHTTLKVTTKYLRLSDEKIKKEHKETHPASRRNLYYGKLQK